LAQNPQSTISISKAISQLQKQFVKSLSQLEGNVTSAELHLATLRKHHQILRKLRSDITCLSCLFQRSERCFSCGHTLCEKCIQALGKQSDEPYKYIFKECPLCGLPCNLNFALKPPTAGVRVLSIDGGGIRGVIPIQTLSDLQSCMEDMILFCCPIQVNFDYAIGTSSGGLVVCGMFLKGWTPADSLKKFVALAKVSFRPRAWVARIPVLLNIHDLLVSYFADSRYSSSGIERALQGVFGQRRMMEHQGHNLHTKVAVTATTIADSSPCIFANYNGEQVLGRESGKGLVDPVLTF